jgi:hypothetical protein
MVGTPMNGHGLASVIWCVVIILISIPLATHVFRNKVSK